MHVSQAYNFKQVDDLLSTSGILNQDQLALLGRERYEAVINLLPDESEYAIKDEASIVESQGIAYEYIAVDFSNPTVRDYQAFERKLQGLAGKKVMVHCAANFRASAFYAIYAYTNLGWSETEARSFMGSIWNPNAHPVWDEFVNGLLLPVAE